MTVGNLTLTIMPNTLLCRIEYFWWWYIRSYRYHLPIDSADLIDVVRCVHIPMDDIPVLLYSTWYDLLVYGTRFPMEHLTFSTLLSISILFECWCVCARVHLWSRFHCYEHPPRCMVLNIDTSTLLIHKPGVGKSTRSLCDIHAGFCSCLLLSVCLFPFLFIYRIYDTFTCVDSLIYAQSTTMWLVGNIPYWTLIELAKPP